MPDLRRLDHVAIAVSDTEQALLYFRDRLGLDVIHVEENTVAQARLTYLDAGNALIQLVEPLNADAQVAQHLREHGEGLHHICFAVSDVPCALAELSGEAAPQLGSGRGRPSGFLPELAHGVRIECTEL